MSGRAHTTWFVPALLVAFVFQAYLHGHMGCSDSRWSIFAATSLIDTHDLTLDEYEPVLRQRGLDFTERVGSHYYNLYPVGVSVLAVPAVLALRPTGALAFHWWPRLRASMEAAQRRHGCPPAEGEVLLALNSWTEQIIASAFVALTALLIYLIALEELAPVPSAVLMLAFAFGTAAWSTASRALWQHGPSMLLLAAALLLLTRGTHLTLAGMALATAYTVRPTNVVPLVLLTLWSIWAYPRKAARYALGVAVVLMPFFALNRHIYGGWLSTYYRPSHFNGNPFFGEALAGLTISPSHGLFVYSPVLAFGFVGVGCRMRRHRFTLLDVALLGCVLVNWISTAWVNPIWWGGDSYGPRLLSDMLPYFFYLLIPAMAWMGDLKGSQRMIVRAAFAVAVASSVVVQAQGVFNLEAINWNHEPTTPDIDPQKLWDWRHPPFLAGLTEARTIPRLPDLNTIPCDARPQPPHELNIASNRNNEVALTWRAPDGPVGYYGIESGNTQGASDLPLREAIGTTIVVRRVPPGTYYVRVRARNACGVSEPSNELSVTVR